MSGRNRISLDGEWAFCPGDVFTNESAFPMQTPSPWQADARWRNYAGPAWYRREFDVPAEWLAPGRVVVLGFGAVDYFAEVWLNGFRIGEHEGGYLPFEMDVTCAVQPGLNRLVVRVEDPLEIFAEIPHGKQSWYGMLSGIWQPVWLESRPAVHIRRVKVITEEETVKVEVQMQGGQPGSLAAELTAPDGSLSRVEAALPAFTFTVSQPLTWSPSAPNLYMLRLFTEEDETCYTFGFRHIETRNGKIYINEKPFYLRAALDQDYYPDLICTPPSQKYIEEQFRKARAMGLNCLRIHIKVADPRYYAAADKIGLLIWTELPNHSLLSAEAKRRARETLAGMVERDWNHPSIGIWTIINESWGVDLTDPVQRAWLAEMYTWLKQLDPGRLVVGNSACGGNFHVATDLADFHNYYAMPDHAEKWRAWVANYASRPGWIFARPYGGHASWRAFARDPWNAPPVQLAPEAAPRGDEPLLVSEFGNWGLPDIANLVAGNHGAEPWWFETGLDWGDGMVYPHNVQQRFFEYHLDKIFPTYSALAQASQRLQFAALKFEIEQIRLQASIQGYVITEFTDVHWECNGLLDMYRNPKEYFARLGWLNADNMLIPLPERLALTAGERCVIPVSCAWAYEPAVAEAEFQWKLELDGQCVDSGQGKALNCGRAGVFDLGTIQFSVPNVQRPSQARLEIYLVGGGRTLATTEQELYFFPAAAPIRGGARIYAPALTSSMQALGYMLVDDMAQADLVVALALDDECREYLLRGGKVLLLAEQSDALQTHIPGLQVTGRAGMPWQGDWASSFGWHRFASLPTGGVVNFAFTGLTPECILQGFAPRDFAGHVLAGMFVGWLHKPVATIAHKRVGSGVLLVSTFQLSQQLNTNPLAAFLFDELIGLLQAA